jgi:hypothetical protein
LLAELPVLLRDATKRHNALLLVNKKASTIVAIRKAAALAAEAGYGHGIDERKSLLCCWLNCRCCCATLPNVTTLYC